MPVSNRFICATQKNPKYFTFYKSVFGRQFIKPIRFKDLPSPEFQVAENDANKIMHIALVVGNDHLLGSDGMEAMGKVTERRYPQFNFDFARKS